MWTSLAVDVGLVRGCGLCFPSSLAVAEMLGSFARDCGLLGLCHAALPVSIIYSLSCNCIIIALLLLLPVHVAGRP